LYDCPNLVDQSEKFQEASKNGNLIPLYRCIFSDHLTPVIAYRCLVKEDDRDAPSFLFESVEPGLQVSSTVSPSVFFVFVFVSLNNYAKLDL
jgi:anthranilate synthase component 1